MPTTNDTKYVVKTKVDWEVKDANVEKPIKTFTNQADALRYAQAMEGVKHILLHDENGKFSKMKKIETGNWEKVIKPPKPAPKPKPAPVAKPAPAPTPAPAPKPAPVAKPVAPVVPKPAVVNKPAKATSNAASTLKAQPALPKTIFKVEANPQVIFDAIMSERASRRQGTHSTKTRGEVSGGGRKPWRQKGTGNARQGSIRSPQWVGGGVVWGPRPNRNYDLKVNKKVKRLAFLSALTLKANNNAVLVHDFEKGDKPSTKDLLTQVQALKLNAAFKKLIIITNDATIWKSASNITHIYATKLSDLTVEAIVNADALIFGNQEFTKLGGNK